jgi:uncharacterized membrane protein YheB (UPF0754 family)
MRVLIERHRQRVAKRKSEEIRRWLLTKATITDKNRVMLDQENITEAIKEAVRESGESLYAICKATGLNEDALSRFMRGQTSMRLDLADKLAEYLGIECRRTRRQKGQ